MRWERLQALRVDWQMHTIDTTDMSIRDVAEGVLDWCRRALNSEAPALRVTDI
jgi:hypothetical protein